MDNLWRVTGKSKNGDFTVQVRAEDWATAKRIVASRAKSSGVVKEITSIVLVEPHMTPAVAVAPWRPSQ